MLSPVLSQSSCNFHFVFHKAITETNMHEKPFPRGALITGPIIHFCSDYGNGLPKADKHL